MIKNKTAIFSAIMGLALIGGVGLSYAGLASAQSNTTMTRRMDGTRPVVFGTVASVNGSTLTITSKNIKDSTTTTYTVDISGATVQKHSANGPVSASASDITVGDTVAISGTVSGTSVTATHVMDGAIGFGPRDGKGRGGRGVMGTVSAVNGNTITITNANGTTYTVDATNAKVSKVSQISVSNIAVGDTVGVQGTVSGTSVTAVHIMDGVK